MKKLRLFIPGLILFAAMQSDLKSQSLSYSQVLLITTVEDTVPAGKVWKVESVLGNNDLQIYTGTTSHQSKNTVIYVNGNNIFVKSTWGSSYGSDVITVTDLPVWLPAGTRLRAGNYATYVSVIEFTEMP